MKEKLKEYFSFTKSQSRGIILLSILCSIALFIFYSLDHWVAPPKKKPILDAEIKKELATIYIDTSGYQKKEVHKKLTPFYFNPNTLNKTGFEKLGLRPKLIRTILNYKSKGGTFYKKEDFKKIWGLNEKEYTQLAPYISIPKQVKQYSRYKKKDEAKAVVRNLHIEINAATSEQFIQLHGIGEKLASNIIKYRKLLGGFYSIGQLKEVYGIRPETFESIKRHLECNPAAIRRININSATLNEMRSHPYLRKDDWALSITKFRKTQDYDIKSLEDLKNIAGMTDEIYLRIVPYLSLQ